ncbi:helix-turn-helix domain-containing protein [Dysgonomonas sp. 25]|uniref:helix-turn-helix domain-containing protein n=1 Tax=Dysgonomonas sp. 25 TaxID=2302933 RepID=UPI0013D71927|nr:helix-turn-helix domain-containing protein [Dysgonomonas sp. 25]NDV69452.1 hypothetical protein [Dysgonomonas sp. 25]
MDPILKKNIVNKIVAKIPSHLNPVDFLQEILGISKESVYRRLKGEIAFSLDDVIKLSSELSFSLDEIVLMDGEKEAKPVSVLFQFRSNKMFDPQKTFSQTLSAYVEGRKRLKKYDDVEILVATNRLMILTSIYYDHIFKFYYYKWIHQTQQMPLNFSLSDVILPDNILSLQEQLKTSESLIDSTNTYILDYNFLKNTLHEIQYYYKRKLISEDEIVLLQNDLSQFIDTMEYMLKQPVKKGNHIPNIYLSTTQIDSTGLYCKFGAEETLDLWISFGSTIHSENTEICKTYRTWFNSLKKYSSLVTGCDEILQTKFIEEQRRHIRDISIKEY